MKFAASSFFKRQMAAVAVLALALLMIAYVNTLRPAGEEETVAEEETPLPYLKNYYVSCGLIPGGLKHWGGTIKKGEHLSEILLPYGISMAAITQVAALSRKHFFVRRIAAGKKFEIFHTPGEQKREFYFVYEPDAVQYVIYSFGDSLFVRTGKKEVEKEMRTAEGHIQSSLWETAVSQGLDMDLPLALADIYAWVIDFNRLQKGDAFRVLYESYSVSGKPVGMGRVQAAWFSHRGEEYYAIYLDEGTSGEFFDEKGNSLRRQFLKSPLKFSRITSSYSLRRYHPVLKYHKPHLGVDYGAPAGTPIMATGEGTVSAAGYTKGNGNFVKIRHNSVYSTQYLHMSRFRKGIRKGIRVRQGEVIGYVGSTGLATGPHVCYRFWKDGRQINPLTLKIPPSGSVKKKYRDKFFRLRDRMIRKLKPTAQEEPA